MVRCKFNCTGVRKYKAWSGSEHDFLFESDFVVVSQESEEDKKFFAATPSGSLKFSTIHADLFEPGKQYYVDISEAETES